MSETFNAARERAINEERGFRPHPFGEFNGVISDVEQKEHEGRAFFEIKIKTNYGKAKDTIWIASEDDLESYFIPKYGSYQAAIDQLQKIWIRHIRIYTDLGLPAPADEHELYDNLHKFIGKPCRIVVSPKSDDPRSQIVFINAANGKADVVKGQSTSQSSETRQNSNNRKPNFPPSFPPRVTANDPTSDGWGDVPF